MWEKIKGYITSDETEHQCKNCDTYWTTNNYISKELALCANCDTCSQPILSNPINRESVLKYIDSKYHEYIFDKLIIFETTTQMIII